MKVFISWSGDRSRAVAELLEGWLRCVIQSARPWLSTKNIDRGALWLGEINSQLKDTNVGIICLTQENRDRPWILFEAGALAKGITTNRVCTFLVDLQPSDITDPLAQFNHTQPTKQSLYDLVFTLNGAMGERALESSTLARVFETYWPQFEADFTQCLADNPASTKAKPRADSELLSEILASTRSLQHRMDRLEQPSAGPSRVRQASGNLASPRVPVYEIDEALSDVRAYSDRGIPDNLIKSRLLRKGISEDLAVEIIREAKATRDGRGIDGSSNS